MKIIAIRQEYAVTDISDEEDVQVIAEKIDLGAETEVQVNLSGCLIDYPATSKLMDVILEKLSLIHGNKKIEIVTDYRLPMPTMLNWLFLGSIRLGIRDVRGLPIGELKEILEKAMCKDEIMLTVIVKDTKGSAIETLTIPDKQL
jgi:hypothetical protein